MAIDNRVMNPAMAAQLMKKRADLERKRKGEPADLEQFPRVVRTITLLWRYAEGQKYLENLIMVEGGKQRQGFPVKAQEELIFLYQLLLDQQAILHRAGQRISAHDAPENSFTIGDVRGHRR